MTEMLQGVLDQFKSILDISGVLPIFGSGGHRICPGWT